MEIGRCIKAEIECDGVKKTTTLITFSDDPLYMGFALHPSEELWRKVKRKKIVKFMEKEWIVLQEVDIAAVTWFICKEKSD